MSVLALALLFSIVWVYTNPVVHIFEGARLCLEFFGCYLWRWGLLSVLLSHSNHDRTSGHDSLRYTFPFLRRCFVALRSASTHAKY